MSGPLQRLNRQAEAIRHFDFSEAGDMSSMVKEVDELSGTMGGMKRTIRRFLDISAAVAEEQDFDRLLPMLLRETLSAAEEWEAVHIGAWLHDCGKVTTPEYVVDKATKLETIYDRIHEVRMRFEVLKRDAEIDCLKDIAAGAAEALFVTMLIGVLDVETGLLTLVNAGHDSPWLIHPDGSLDHLDSPPDAGGPPIQLAPGDALVMYTDGITEAMNAEHEIYGGARLEAALPSALQDWLPQGHRSYFISDTIESSIIFGPNQ